MQIKIQENEADQRFDRFLRKYFKAHSEIKLWDIYSWIRKWVIKVNWRKFPEEKKLQIGDEITFDIPKDIENNPLSNMLSKEEKKENIDINKIKPQILYEDQNRIFWNKPVWLVVHPWNKHTDDLTLNEFLDAYIDSKEENIKSATFKPAFCFRLDKDTSWIIIAAKNYDWLKYLNELIRLRKTDKTYLTIVKWIPPKSKVIDAPLFRGFNKKFGKAETIVNHDEWLKSVTEIKLLKTFKDKNIWDISLVEAKILTWRMHQIRVHMTHIWHPIIWDLMYWDAALNRLANKHYKVTRQLLHSHTYSFFDIFTKKNIRVSSPIPQDFKAFFDI